MIAFSRFGWREGEIVEVSEQVLFPTSLFQIPDFGVKSGITCRILRRNREFVLNIRTFAAQSEELRYGKAKTDSGWGGIKHRLPHKGKEKGKNKGRSVHRTPFFVWGTPLMLWYVEL